MNTFLEFGIKRENEERRDGGCAVIFDPETKKFAVGRDNWGANILRLFGGGFDKNEDPLLGTLREVREESGLCNFLETEELAKVFVHYFNRTKNVNRCAESVCYLLILKNTDLIETQLEDHENFNLVYVDAQEMLDKWEAHNENKDFDHWIYFLQQGIESLKKRGIY
ncbi:MAG: NUDIX hydrolase [Candidatus Pacebacteria bacterium]|nr:NUDIX hydrolase [Candidatus Paceibacterota bacterium]MCF7863074.1 NUDIX hydrolase [Candidatus Paceibacterota bacterium]